MTRDGFKTLSRKHMPTPARLEKQFIQEGVHPLRARTFAYEHIEARKLSSQREQEEKQKLSTALKTIRNAGSAPDDIRAAASVLLDLFHFDGVKNLLQVFADANRPLEIRVAALQSSAPLLVSMYKYDRRVSEREFKRAGRTFLYVVNSSTSQEDLRRLKEEIASVENQVRDAINAYRDRIAMMCNPKETG